MLVSIPAAVGLLLAGQLSPIATNRLRLSKGLSVATAERAIRLRAGDKIEVRGKTYLVTEQSLDRITRYSRRPKNKH